MRSHQRIHTDNKPYVWKTSDIDIKRAMNDEHLNDHHLSLKINLMCAIRVIETLHRRASTYSLQY